MKHLKLFESFDEIDSICKEFGIENWTVNLDGTVDVDGDVDISFRALHKIPIKFGRVTGTFNCGINELTTLEGAPKEIGRSFFSFSNELTSLEGGPIEVGGDFSCRSNKLITLEGAPKLLAGSFNCNNNPIWEVYRLFKNYKSYMDSLDYGYLRGTNIDKRRLQEALDELGIRMPKSITGYKYI